MQQNIIYQKISCDKTKGQNMNYLLCTVAKNRCACVYVGLPVLPIIPILKASTSRWSLAACSKNVADFHHNASRTFRIFTSSRLGGNWWHMPAWWMDGWFSGWMVKERAPELVQLMVREPGEPPASGPLSSQPAMGQEKSLPLLIVILSHSTYHPWTNCSWITF